MPPEPVVSKRPSNSRFKQQRLPAWRPILTPRTVLPTFFATGIVFLAVGIALLTASNSVKEVIINYTDCLQSTSSSKCSDLVTAPNNQFTNVSSSSVCVCDFNITLDKGFDDSDVYMFYALDNYYQNHRRYVKSRWDPQLHGLDIRGGAECDPLRSDDQGKPYVPCGLVANSLFNDTIEIFKCDQPGCPTKIPLNGKGIAWDSDVDTKFGNPNFADPAFAGTSKPKNWPVTIDQLGTAIGDPKVAWSTTYDSHGIGYLNEDFIVWMRTAALPNFRKLYRKIQGQSLPDGTYRLKIQYNYPVTQFDGEKKVVLTTLSWLGGRNPFLGACYIVVACVCLVVGILFVVFQKQKGRQLGDARFLKWDRD